MEDDSHQVNDKGGNKRKGGEIEKKRGKERKGEIKEEEKKKRKGN